MPSHSYPLEEGLLLQAERYNKIMSKCRKDQTRGTKAAERETIDSAQGGSELDSQSVEA